MSQLLLNDYLHIIADDIPDVLVSRNSFHRMLKVGELLPGSISRFFGFECRLDNDEGNADILVCVSPYGQERAILADRNASIRLPTYLWDYPAWQQVRAFAGVWEHAESTIHNEVLNLWLEFDIHTHSEPWQTPSVFFGTRPGTGAGHDWIGDDALPLLRDNALAGGGRVTLNRCIEMLPEGAYIFQTGLMLSRKDTPVRICIKSIAPRDIVSYL